MKKILTATVLGTAALMATAVSASAATIATYDNKMTFETPNDSWHEQSDPDTKITLTNGKDKVEVREYDINDSLPTPIIKAENFAEVYQTYYSTSDTVYVMTGYATTINDIEDVRTMMASMKLADHPYKNGNVQNQSEQKKDPQKDDPQKDEPTRTGNSQTVYYKNSNSDTIYEYSDGKWRNDQGVEFWRTTDGQWANSEGSVLYDYVPEVQAEDEKTGNSMTLYFENGNTVGPVYEYNNGQWLDDDGVSYTNCGDYWQSSQGSRLYDHELSIDEMNALHGNDGQNEDNNNDDDNVDNNENDNE